MPYPQMPHPHLLNGVYAITDGSTGDDLFSKVEQALEGGIAILQYRDKTQDSTRRLTEANTLRELCHHANIPLIINDDVQLAKHSQADGVHLGADDSSFQYARESLGQEPIIGVSCYNDIARAQQAELLGADYVAFGSFFPSPTKPHAPRATTELLRIAQEQLTTPICCIGGITLDNASQLLQEKPDMLAVISAIFATANITESSHTFAELFKR